MKKTFLLIILCVLNLNAQKKWETKEVKYNNGVCILGVLDMESKKMIKAIPNGKNASILYDPFYNSYLIIWEESDGRKQFDLIAYKETPLNGTIYRTRKNGISEDKQDEYFIINEINKNGKLHVMDVYPIENDGKQYKLMYTFDDFD
jgi:hypothetical protein